MKPDLPINSPEGCDAFQQLLSEMADSGGTLSPELQEHLRSCPECAQFAETWFYGMPAVLAQPVADAPDARLRDRILRAAAAPPDVIVPFLAPPASRPLWMTWLGRIAAGVALAGFSYWLLDPVTSPVGSNPSVAYAPTFTQGLTQMEDKTKREQKAVQTALVDGGREVHGNVAWAVSALDL